MFVVYVGVYLASGSVGVSGVGVDMVVWSRCIQKLKANLKASFPSVIGCLHGSDPEIKLLWQGVDRPSSMFRLTVPSLIRLKG